MSRITLAFALTTAVLVAPPAAHAGDDVAPTRLAQAQQQQGRQGGGPGPGMRGGGPGGGGGMMQPRRMLQMLDQDGDGRLDREEFVETPRPGAGANTEMAERNRAARFDQLDTDGDGQLDADELANRHDMMAQ